MIKIRWSKEYQEEKGAETEDGFYGYDYRYYVYWFWLPNQLKLRARRYTDTPDLCSIFIELDKLRKLNDPESLKTLEYMSGVVHFLLKHEGVKTLTYFSEGYKPVDLAEFKNNFKDFVFEETIEK